MAAYRVRRDLERAFLDRFALPLGIVARELDPPTTGYTVAYQAGEEEEPDTYSFYVTVSHERVGPLVNRIFELLPAAVYGVVEISSCDAYRSVDVFIGGELIDVRRFATVWDECEEVLLEDGMLGAGAYSEDPFIEVFLDTWKGISVIVPLAMRDEVESILHEAGLVEVAETWPGGLDDRAFTSAEVRPVIDAAGGQLSVDDVLYHLRAEWHLELNVDPEKNVDDAGRELGMTLWEAHVGVADPVNGSSQDADVKIWATAGSLSDVELLIDAALSDWRFAETYAIDRVAFDARPPALSDLSPKRDRAEVHLVIVEPRQPRAPGPERG